MRKELKVFFETTNYCNYKCIYCFANTCKSNQTVLSLDKFKTVIDTLAKLNCDLSILLEGGEPLTVENICEYGEYAKKYVKKIALGSNASLVPTLKQEQINKIKNTFEEISVGFDTNDKNLFEKLVNYPIEPSLDGIDILLKNEIKIKLCAVVTKLNVDFDNIVNFCEKKGIKKLRFYWFIPRDSNDHSLLPSEDDYKYMLKKLNEYKGKLDIKINRNYTKNGNLVVSSKGEIRTNDDIERKNMKLIGNYNNFYENLNKIVNEQ